MAGYFIGASEEEGRGRGRVGVARMGSDWTATLTVADATHSLGVYADENRAALAYDMEALRAFGTGTSALNFRYEVLEENAPSNGNRLKVRDQHGLEMAVDVCDSTKKYSPVYARMPAVKKSFNAQDGSNVSSRGAPPLPDLSRSWPTRTSSLYTPSASFIYEITFPHKKSLGLNLKPHFVYYSPDSDECVGTLVVVEAMTLLSSLVYPGDIILQINGTNMSNYGSKFNFDDMTSLITSATPPRTVKFMRPCGPSHTLSPAEIFLFLGLSADPSSRDLPDLIVTPKQPASLARFNVVVSATGASQSLQLVHLENDAPLAMKRLMQGMQVNWEGNPAQKVQPEAPVSSISAANERKRKEILVTPDVFQESASTTIASGGVIHKWVAQLVISPGWFDKEIVNKQHYKQETMVTTTRPITNAVDTQSTFGAILDSSPSTGSIEIKTQKRKRIEPILSPCQQAYKKKMTAKNKFEKVYFLGKFDFEADARAVVEIAKKEAAENGGLFIPHKISPPLRSATTTSSSATVVSAPQQSLPPSTATGLANNSSVPSATTNHTQSSSQVSRPSPVNSNQKSPQYHVPKYIHTKSAKRVSATKAVAAAFKNNGPHSKRFMNLGFSTMAHSGDTPV